MPRVHIRIQLLRGDRDRALEHGIRARSPKSIHARRQVVDKL